ncbi:MAG TPA: tRNA adenosine(34) deaminase TadA [Variovorax sp.]|nr:tRNA adenosine(34) deaminase TadA [Variovorax sp.]
MSSDPAKILQAPSDDAHWMSLALAEARVAKDAGEVPVGAVLVKNGALVASGRNAPVAGHDPTAHAEIAALRAAAQVLGNYRLDGCELFVTLEPCAMCAGAMLHARLARVVFGAADPKTGAAGSVLDLFANAQLNHQTAVQGGVMAGECTELLQEFFRGRRERARAVAQPLRDDALRTPEACFSMLPASPWPERQVADLPALQGLRMNYLDTAPDAVGGAACLCLHGAGMWSFHLHALVNALMTAGARRVLAPDLVGFGKSDKPKREAFHTLEWHRDVLLQWLDWLSADKVVLVVCESMRALGEAVAAAAPGRVVALLEAAESTAPELEDARGAPFPDRGFEAALRAFGRPRKARHVAAEEAGALAHRVMGYFAAT